MLKVKSITETNLAFNTISKSEFIHLTMGCNSNPIARMWQPQVDCEDTNASKRGQLYIHHCGLTKIQSNTIRIFRVGLPFAFVEDPDYLGKEGWG